MLFTRRFINAERCHLQNPAGLLRKAGAGGKIRRFDDGHIFKVSPAATAELVRCRRQNTSGETPEQLRRAGKLVTVVSYLLDDLAETIADGQVRVAGGQDSLAAV